jgi:hypothetical protein
MFTRHRNVKLDEAINPCYVPEWGQASAKDAINTAIFFIEEIVHRRLAKYGEIRMIVPQFEGDYSVYEYIQEQLLLKFSRPDIQVICGSEKFSSKDVLIRFVPFTIKRPKYAIPYCWKDNEKDWTWEDVINNGQYYSSSSTDIGPPFEWRMRAQRELVKKLESQEQVQLRRHNAFENELKARRVSMKNLESQRREVLKKKHEDFLREKPILLN